ncbi:MAG: hypothetical protein DRP85_07185 [Candidatus Makaraimicrobium thalassicum]|nr:MAG: hypothetical protein DRP85_07185 [Candidatus Omnitrophota bacterium]
MRNTAVIELGQHYIKIAAAGYSIKKILRKFFCLVVPVSSPDDDAQTSKLLSEAFAGMKLKPRFLVLSLPRRLVTARTLSLPSKDQKEISKMVDLHVDRILPCAKEEIASIYSVLEKTEFGYSKILLCVVRKDILKRQLRIVADAGFFVDKIYLNSYGVWEWNLSNCRSQIEADGVYLGLDIDCDYTELIVFSREHLLFTRSVIIRAEQLLEETGRVQFIREVKQSLAIFRSEYEYKKPEKICISGAISELKELEGLLQRELEIPVTSVPIGPLIGGLKTERVEIPRFVSVTPLREFLFSNSRRVSFSILETQLRKAFREKTRDLMMIGSLVIYISFIICGVFLGRICNRQAYFERLQSHLESIGPDTEDLIRKSKRIDSVKGVLESREQPLLFLEEIHRAVSSRIAIKAIKISRDNEVVLRGEAAALSDVFEFIEVLKKIESFNNIQTKYTRKKKTREGEFTDFGLNFVLEY